MTASCTRRRRASAALETELDAAGCIRPNSIHRHLIIPGIGAATAESWRHVQSQLIGRMT